VRAISRDSFDTVQVLLQLKKARLDNLLPHNYSNLSAVSKSFSDLLQ